MYLRDEKISSNINRKSLIEKLKDEVIYSWMLTKFQEKIIRIFARKN